MRELPPIIDERPQGARARASVLLRGRRLSAAALLALAEVIYVLIARPSTLFISALAFIALILAFMGITRIRPGLLRDVLIVIALSQALVLMLPLVIGLGFVVGVIAALGLLALIVAAAFRLRV